MTFTSCKCVSCKHGISKQRPPLPNLFPEQLSVAIIAYFVNKAYKSSVFCQNVEADTQVYLLIMHETTTTKSIKLGCEIKPCTL